MKPRQGTAVRAAMPFRALVQRFSFLLLVLLAAAMMVAGRLDPSLAEGLRTRVADAMVPLLDALSRPLATVRSTVDNAAELVDLRAENARLREANARLLQWQAVAMRLDAENRGLRHLMRFAPEPPPSFITGRVVADPGSAFVRSVLVAAGTAEGVRKGQPAIAATGVVGRVLEVGENAARVLLITDLNARIPVVLEQSRHRAVLGGDNTDQPKLLYLPPELKVQPGERVVTSGDGGPFPPGLPVGVVSRVSEGLIRVQPFADLSRLEYVRLVDYTAVRADDLPGGQRVAGRGVE
ncbi:MAG TPA: rod shape-determining protein MreC [Alphaproteobacteria bacterium]|nr:rod shape-determining protein MreC [Alphaproteobacteria bacterium]